MKATSLKPFYLFLVGVTMLMLGIALAIPTPAEAQCGSSASSCKSCHETQGEYPVNTEGEWHTQHAFGDFCEFCHAGNVQATEKDAAHQGLAVPLDDVNASCLGCHPEDVMERGEIYASALGVELGSGSSGGGDGASGGSNGAIEIPTTGIAAPLGGEEIDYNILYAEKMAPPPLIKSWGNVILVMMLLGLAGVFLFVAWTWEGWGGVAAKWINKNVKVVSDAVTDANASVSDENVPSSAELAALFEQKPELRELWPVISQSDDDVLASLAQILQDEENGPDIIQAIGKLGH